jgi:BASS family bile acid:Na+ symporter
METLLRSLLDVAVPLFAITSMAGLGLDHDLREVTAPLRKPGMVFTAFIANFVAMPLWSLLLIRGLGLDESQSIGLFLCGSAAGAAFTVKLVRSARGDVALAGGLLLLLVPSTLVYLPLVLPRVLPQVRVDTAAIAWTLAWTMLLPMGVGSFVRWRRPGWARRLVPPLGKVSTASLVVLLLATVLAHLGSIALLLRTPALLAAALLVAGGVVIGYALGVPNPASRTVLALGTGQRNIAAAMLIASELTSPEPLVMVVVSSLVFFTVLFPAAWLLRRHEWARGVSDPFDRRPPVHR